MNRESVQSERKMFRKRGDSCGGQRTAVLTATGTGATCKSTPPIVPMIRASIPVRSIPSETVGKIKFTERWDHFIFLLLLLVIFCVSKTIFQVK